MVRKNTQYVIIIIIFILYKAVDSLKYCYVVEKLKLFNIYLGVK